MLPNISKATLIFLLVGTCLASMQRVVQPRILYTITRVPTAWGHFALAKRSPCMGMGTLCTGKKAPMYGHGDTLHRQKGPHVWAWVHFALAKRPPCMGMGTLCTGKMAPMYGHGDTLHWQKGPRIWAWGHLTLAKRPPYMGMGTLCTSKMAPIYAHGDT